MDYDVSKMTQAELDKLLASEDPNRMIWRSAKAERERRQSEEEKKRHDEISERLSRIDGRLVAVENSAKKPESKTWAFWLAVIAIIVGLAGVVIAVLSWQRPVPTPNVSAQVSPAHSAPLPPPVSPRPH
jgi:hypothetical protein